MTKLQQIIQNLNNCGRTFNKDLIKKAYNFARHAHEGQKRLTGEPYFTHPVFVAEFLSKLCFDDKTIAAALLHDVCEDTKYNLNDIRENFGSEVSKLVNGVTKLKGLKTYGETKDIENLRKMFLAIAEDLRVAIIRLTDRLHNVKTLYVFSPEKAKRIATQTIEIYAPLAERLGIGELKGQLEDLAFPYYLPQKYREVKSLVKEGQEERKRYIKKVINYLQNLLKKEGINAEIHGRAKHLYSLYKKLQRYDNDIKKIYDLQAVRIIVSNVEECYKILGLIHKKWKPLPGRIKDYIALPKPNGYRSLHTTVFALDGKIIEIQIKTKEMHEEAEWGLAAHWYYKEKQVGTKIKDKIRWIEQLNKWQKDLRNREEFIESLKFDFFKNRIFVFTPSGDVLDLPEGATPVDFAYYIHSEVGNSCVGAKVDGQIVPLDFQLKNGNMVEILTKKGGKGPKLDWLNFVKTSLAKDRIRSWFKKKNKQVNLEAGKKKLEEDLKKIGKDSLNKISKEKINEVVRKFNYKNLDSLLIAIGEGVLNSEKVIKKLFAEDHLIKKPESRIARLPLVRKFLKKPSIQVAGEDGVNFKIAACCKPVIGEPIIGFITRGKGITVHKKNCPNIVKAPKDQLINVSWGEKPQIYQIPVLIKGIDRIGFFKDVSQVASSLGINILSVSSPAPKNKEINMHLVLEINDISQITSFFRDVKNVKGVTEVKRE